MSILNDSGLNNINENLNLQTFYAKDVVENLLTKNSSFPCIKTLINNQNVISNLRNLSKIDSEKIDHTLKSIIECEKKLEFFYEGKNSLENLEEDTFGQLIFQHSELKVFNTFPFLLLIISYIKIYFIPIVSVVLPVIMYFLPYLIIKYVWNMPITYEMYQTIMGKMWSFSLDNTSLEKILQNAFAVFTFAQSMYQPIQNALHLNKINTTINDLGKYLYDYSMHITNLKSILDRNNIKFKLFDALDTFCNSMDYRKNFSYVLENPVYLTLVSNNVSLFELLYTISKNSDFKKVNLYSSTDPFLQIVNCYDINLSKDKRVGSDFHINSDSKHFLLSGPNGGGKSSFLRGLLQTVLFSQGFGYAIGDSIDYSPFDYIFSGLHIQDIPGQKSLFEKEVCFARDVLYYNNPAYKGLVLFDEIFHSTNPPDGIRTANEFLNKLYTYDHIASIISTHVFEIIEHSPPFVKKICVKAHREENVLIYDYKLSEGICKESSVTEIWAKVYDSADQ